jgi:hypothetical protein
MADVKKVLGGFTKFLYVLVSSGEEKNVETELGSA